MTNANTQNTLPQGEVEFAENHRPSLTAANYQIAVQQSITIDNKLDTTHFPTARQNFSVSGPQFSLAEGDINSVFPPAGSLGDHANVLPHVVLARSTLPWERTADPSDESEPPTWLALLVFDDAPIDSTSPLLAAAPTPKVTSIKQLLNRTNSTSQFPTLTLEAGSYDENEKVTVIDIDGATLKAIAPKLEELNWLAHVRTSIGAFNTQFEQAIIVANRRPRRGAMSTVHLVSMEGHYSHNNEIPDTGVVRLLSLKSWRFSCIDDKHNLTQLLSHLNLTLDTSSTVSNTLFDDLDKRQVSSEIDALFNQQGKALTAPVLINIEIPGERWRVTDAAGLSFVLKRNGTQLENYRHSMATLRLPQNPDSQAEGFLSAGNIPLRHSMREGEQNISWYHGPLLPGEQTQELSGTLPAQGSDQLLRFDLSLALFDTSYAAAWELGRLLTIQKKTISVALYQWKRRNRQLLHQTEQALMHDHLAHCADAPSVKLPAGVLQWFQQLRLLKGVPFNYLVPDEKILPVESLRFFCLDGSWVDSLIDGAFSVGRVTNADHIHDVVSAKALPLLSSQDPLVSGFLLRSSIVAGFPDLKVEAYDLEEHLFDIDSNQIADLNQRTPSTLLIKMFSDNGHRLGEDVYIETVSSKNQWVIGDKHSEISYAILAEENNLSVYGKRPLQTIRSERLSKNVLLCMFTGKVEFVDFHLPAEVIHFGMNPPSPEPQSGDPNGYFKELRDYNRPQTEIGEAPGISVAIDWRGQPDDRVVDISTLAETIKGATGDEPFTSAQFALQMIEGVTKVRFMRGHDGKK